MRVEIKRQIRRLIRQRQLVGLPKLYVNDQRVRCILLTPSVAGAVIGEGGGLPSDERLAQFRGNLDGFAMGEHITIASDPFEKWPQADLAPVHPIDCHLWNFRVLEPERGIRCSGFFAARDTFIAVSWEYREDIETEYWRELIASCKTI